MGVGCVLPAEVLLQLLPHIWGTTSRGLQHGCVG
jgi:hypothetical protein